MILRLSQLPPLRGPDDQDYKGQVPTRARVAAPDVAAAILELEHDTGGLVYTDIWRSAESSLMAHRKKRGVQPPAYSGHNFGLCVDLDLYPCMKKLGKSYGQLSAIMEAHFWFCYRRDKGGPDESEAWHFNYLGPDFAKYLSKTDHDDHNTWAGVAEQRIYERYGKDFVLTPVEVQQKLAKLRMYNGDIDGNVKSMHSRESVMVFQRAWDLVADGDAGPKTQRTLAVVTADTQIVTIAPVA